MLALIDYNKMELADILITEACAFHIWGKVEFKFWLFGISVFIINFYDDPHFY